MMHGNLSCVAPSSRPCGQRRRARVKGFVFQPGACAPQSKDPSTRFASLRLGPGNSGGVEAERSFTALNDAPTITAGNRNG